RWDKASFSFSSPCPLAHTSLGADEGVCDSAHVRGALTARALGSSSSARRWSWDHTLPRARARSSRPNQASNRLPIWFRRRVLVDLYVLSALLERSIQKRHATI